MSKHGMRNHRLYMVYNDMIFRCYREKRPAYRYYGARGIEVCPEWRESREAFFAWALVGWKRGLFLDRIDNDGPYSPENCRWSTVRESNRNRSITKLNIADAAVIKDLTSRGLRHGLVAALYGVSRQMVSRIHGGNRWPDASSYLTPNSLPSTIL